MNHAIHQALRRLAPHIAGEMATFLRNHPDFEVAALRGDWSAIATTLENHVYQGGRGNGDWRFGVVLAQASLAASAGGLDDTATRLEFEAAEVLRYIPEPAMAELMAALNGRPIPAPAGPAPAGEDTIAALWNRDTFQFAIAPPTPPPPADWSARIEADPEAALLEILEILEQHPGISRSGQLDAEVQKAVEELRRRGTLSTRIAASGVEFLCRGGSSGARFLVGDYAVWCAERDPHIRRRLELSFTQKSYDTFDNWRVPPVPASSFNDWEYQGWAVGDEDWPLAARAWKWIPEERLLQLLDQPVTGVAERSIHYLILRRFWRHGGENFPRLDAIARLIGRVEGDPEKKPLFERALLVFDQQWRALGLEWRKQEAARVFQAIDEIGRAAGLPPGDDFAEGSDTPPPEPPPPDPDAHLPPMARQRAHRLRSLRQRIAHHPDDVEARFELGELYREAGDLDDAIAAFTEVTIRAPLFAFSHYQLGKIRMAQKQYARARQDFSNVITLFEERGGMEQYLDLEKPPDAYVDSYRTRGVAWCHEGDYTRGLDDMSAAVRLRRDDARLVWERGYLREKAGLREAAVEDYLRAGLLHLDSGDGAKAAECATALERLGALQEAAQLRPARQEPPESDLP